MSTNTTGGSNPVARVLPVVLPPVPRHDFPWLADGVPGERLLELGRALADVVDRARAQPDAALITDHADTALDLVSDVDALAVLAADMAAVGAGSKPEPADLLGAPTLTDWRYEERPRRVVTGRLAGPAGRARRIVTSELFASDGESWARSRTRWYRLGDPCHRAKT